MVSSLLNILYPPKCALCGALGPEPVCGACFSHFDPQPAESLRVSEPLDYGHALFDYTGLAAITVQRFKYERITSLADWMADLMANGAEERGVLNVDIIVPVPIHWSRTVTRGFNQAVLLSEKLPHNLVETGVLRLIKATRPQVGLSHEERARNLEGAFEVIGDVSGKSVVLMDDVLTSGGTAYECAKVLKAAGAIEVGIYTFAAERRWRN